MRTIGHLALLRVAGPLSGCITVRPSASPGIDFDRYRSFTYYQQNVSALRRSFERSPACPTVASIARSRF
jgi:hypothetical protein